MEGLLNIGEWIVQSNYKEQIITIFRLVLAAVCGGIIGIERGIRRRPAGLRTHMLVCMASALVILINQYVVGEYRTGDPTRMAAQVISGIGFLGAGTILTDRKNHIRGLTTAAGLWASACIGLAIGVGYYVGGILASILLLFIFVKLVPIEKHFSAKYDYNTFGFTVQFENKEQLMNFIQQIFSKGYHLKLLEVQEVQNKDQSGNRSAIGAKLELIVHRDSIIEFREMMECAIQEVDGLLLFRGLETAAR